MHQGVIRDMEQQARVKAERQLDFDTQRALEAEYRKVQTVVEGEGAAGAAAAKAKAKWAGGQGQG
jgi:protein PET117